MEMEVVVGKQGKEHLVVVEEVGVEMEPEEEMVEMVKCISF